MHVTLYRGQRGNVPIEQTDFDSWPEIVEALREVLDIEAPDKGDLLAFSPVRLSTPKRANDNVTEVTLLVLDVDKIDDLEALLERVAELPPAFVYASPSDTPDDRRVRIVAPLSRPLKPEECAPARLRYAEALGLEPGCGVEGALDPSRLFFIGRVKGTPPRETWEFK